MYSWRQKASWRPYVFHRQLVDFQHAPYQLMKPDGMTEKKSEVRAALATCRNAFVMTAAFSAFINLLMLVSPMYMMQVYDRVLHSRSEATLLMLTLITVGLLGVMALLEVVRSACWSASAAGSTRR